MRSSFPTTTASRWKKRLLVAMLLACLGLLLAMFWYRDAGGLTNENEPFDSLDTVESNPVNEFAESAHELSVPVTAITACLNQEIIDAAEHPLLPLLEMAEQGVRVIEQNVQDYTANISKKIRWKGKLQPEQSVFCKIRHPRTDQDSGVAVPFSVYTRFHFPKQGQEAIWVDGWYDNKLVAHGPKGLTNWLTLHLDPEGSMAMSGNRYPIQKIGMLNLIQEMIENGNQNLDHDDCQVLISRNVFLGDVACTRFEVIHEQELERFEYHRAEIYIDDHQNLPIAFRSFLWPEVPGGSPRLLEMYHYTDIRINVGLTDADFDPANKQYNFPGY